MLSDRYCEGVDAGLNADGHSQMRVFATQCFKAQVWPKFGSQVTLTVRHSARGWDREDSAAARVGAGAHAFLASDAGKLAFWCDPDCAPEANVCDAPLFSRFLVEASARQGPASTTPEAQFKASALARWVEARATQIWTKGGALTQFWKPQRGRGSASQPQRT